jgi:hypothetical protein
LLGTDADDKFARRASEVVNQITATWSRTSPAATPIPRRFGPYVVGDRLGRGGMSTVFQAVHERTGRVVAIKTAPSDSVTARFLRDEALALGGLEHRGIVQVLDHGEQDGFVWMALQMVRGRTLAQVIHQRWRALPRSHERALAANEVREITLWFRDMALALDSIHARGVVHRDIKPANLMIADDGTPYLIDFGLLHESSEDSVIDTLAGTVPYMSPEQVLALTTLDGRTDLYSLAACLFESLTGRRLVGDDQPRIGLLRQVAFTHAPRLSSVAPWVDRAYDGVLAKALAKDPRHRYASARQFATDLALLAEGRAPLHARPTWSVTAWRHRRGMAVLAVVLVACGYLGTKWWQRHADLAALRAHVDHARALKSNGADAAASALEEAAKLAPRYAHDQEFEDVYSRALSDLAPVITNRLFQRASLVRSTVADASFAGGIAALAQQHLSLAHELGSSTRDELTAQLMLTHLQAGRNTEALALASSCTDERVQEMAVVARLQQGEAVDATTLPWLHEAPYANLDGDAGKLFCRAFVVLELSGFSAQPMTSELQTLASALEKAARSSRPEDRSAVLGLEALARLRLGEFGPAEDLLVTSLSDAPDGPTHSDRPTFLMLAAAARLREGASRGEADPQSSRVAAERFLAATAIEPGLGARFTFEVVHGVVVSETPPSLDRALAEFFEVLADQHAPAQIYSGGIVGLLRLAVNDWYLRHKDASNQLIATGWEPFLRIADTVAKSEQPLLFDTTDEDLQHRWLFWTAVHTAGKPYFLAGPDRNRCLQRCAAYRAAAERLLPEPRFEIELAYAGVNWLAHRADEAAWSRFVNSLSAAERGAAAWPAGDRRGTLALIEMELDMAHGLGELHEKENH